MTNYCAIIQSSRDKLKLSYMGYIGMCAVKGIVFKQFTIGYINKAFGSTIGYHFSGN